jgi:hypothetical protein
MTIGKVFSSWYLPILGIVRIKAKVLEWIVKE